MIAYKLIKKEQLWLVSIYNRDYYFTSIRPASSKNVLFHNQVGSVFQVHIRTRGRNRNRGRNRGRCSVNEKLSQKSKKHGVPVLFQSSYVDDRGVEPLTSTMYIGTRQLNAYYNNKLGQHHFFSCNSRVTKILSKTINNNQHQLIISPTHPAHFFVL